MLKWEIISAILASLHWLSNHHYKIIWNTTRSWPLLSTLSFFTPSIFPAHLGHLINWSSLIPKPALISSEVSVAGPQLWNDLPLHIRQAPVFNFVSCCLFDEQSCKLSAKSDSLNGQSVIFLKKALGVWKLNFQSMLYIVWSLVLAEDTSETFVHAGCSSFCWQKHWHFLMHHF